MTDTDKPPKPKEVDHDNFEYWFPNWIIPVLAESYLCSCGKSESYVWNKVSWFSSGTSSGNSGIEWSCEHCGDVIRRWRLPNEFLHENM